MNRSRRAERVLPPYARWLEQHYIRWQLAQGRKVTIKMLADFLGLPYTILSQYLNGLRTPGPERVNQIAVRLGGDFEGHDILGLPRPDANWLRLTDCWPRLSAAAQADLVLQAERLTQPVESL